MKKTLKDNNSELNINDKPSTNILSLLQNNKVNTIIPKSKVIKTNVNGTI